MSATDNPTNDPRPTEEIYLELEELRAAAAHAPESPSEGEVLPKVRDDDPSSIKARIARLRAMLSDRGANVVE